MASIVVSGDTSGAITLQAPAVAGSTTLNLPASSGTVLTSVSPASDLPSSIKGPAFSAYASSGTSISNGAFTKVLYDVEEFDTANCYSSSRFTPNVAGYYLITASNNITSGTIGTNNVMTIYKNGSWYRSGSSYYWSISSIIYCNGSTDYIEIYIFNNATGAVTGTSTYNYFAGSMIRAA